MYKKLLYTTITMGFIAFVCCIIDKFVNGIFYYIGLILAIIAFLLSIIGYYKAFKLGIILEEIKMKSEDNSKIIIEVPYYRIGEVFKYMGIKILVSPYIDKHSCKHCFFYQPNNVFCDIIHGCRFANRKDKKDVFFKPIIE